MIRLNKKLFGIGIGVGFCLLTPIAIGDTNAVDNISDKDIATVAKHYNCVQHFMGEVIYIETIDGVESEENSNECDIITAVGNISSADNTNENHDAFMRLKTAVEESEKEGSNNDQ